MVGVLVAQILNGKVTAKDIINCCPGSSGGGNESEKLQRNENWDSLPNLRLEMEAADDEQVELQSHFSQILVQGKPGQVVGLLCDMMIILITIFHCFVLVVFTCCFFLVSYPSPTILSFYLVHCNL